MQDQDKRFPNSFSVQLLGNAAVVDDDNNLHDAHAEAIPTQEPFVAVDRVSHMIDETDKTTNVIVFSTESKQAQELKMQPEAVLDYIITMTPDSSIRQKFHDLVNEANIALYNSTRAWWLPGTRLNDFLTAIETLQNFVVAHQSRFSLGATKKYYPTHDHERVLQIQFPRVDTSWNLNIYSNMW